MGVLKAYVFPMPEGKSTKVRCKSLYTAEFFCCFDVIDRIREISILQRKITVFSLLSDITRIN